MRRLATPFCLVLTAVILLSGTMSATAVTRKKAKELREEKDDDNSPRLIADHERQGASISLFLLLNKVTGDAAREIEFYGGRFQNKLAAGFGGSLEAPLTNNLYMSGSLDLEWSWPHQGAGSVRLSTISVRSRWLFSPFRRSTYFAAIGTGVATGLYQGDYEIDDDLGSHFSLYFSLGRQVRFGGNSINGFELYYRIIFSENGDLNALVFNSVPFNVSTIGLRLIIGFEF